MERIKQKKERLLDMRTDGEITKEEFLHQRQKLDTVVGRKNKAVVTLCQEEADDTPDSRWVIHL